MLFGDIQYFAAYMAVRSAPVPLFIARTLENLIMIPLNTLIISYLINKLKAIK